MIDSGSLRLIRAWRCTTKASLRLPTAYTILSVLIAPVWLGKWFVPAGQYERAENPECDREVPVPGTYEGVDQNPDVERIR